MRKNHPSELQVDLMLALLEAPQTASDALATVAYLCGGEEPPLATFYRQLQRAVDRGWIRREPEPDASSERRAPARGRPHLLCRLTPAGKRVLEKGLETYRRRLSLAQALGLVSGRRA